MNSPNGKVAFSWSALTFLIGLLMTVIGWGVRTEVGLANRPDKQAVEAKAKEIAENEAKGKANREDVVRLDEQIKGVTRTLEKIDAKLDTLLAEKRERRRER